MLGSPLQRGRQRQRGARSARTERAAITAGAQPPFRQRSGLVEHHVRHRASASIACPRWRRRRAARGCPRRRSSPRASRAKARRDSSRPGPRPPPTARAPGPTRSQNNALRRGQQQHAGDEPAGDAIGQLRHPRTLAGGSFASAGECPTRAFLADSLDPHHDRAQAVQRPRYDLACPTRLRTGRLSPVSSDSSHLRIALRP